MSQAILLLRIEHEQAGELLNIIDEQLTLDHAMDLELLRDVVEYFREFPDQCHHPIEDLVFRYIEDRAPGRAVTVAEILSEHERISGLTARFGSALESVMAGKNADEDELRVVAAEFITAYRAHIQAEEDFFFPLALAELQPNDWHGIEYSLFDSRDPLYKPEAEDRFRALRHKINERAMTSFRRAAFLRETKTLERVTDVDAFNNAMTSTNSEYRLVEHPGGSFGLEHLGRIVIDIPKCSPARAAWCAYFHMAALDSDETYGHY